jgi:hypothetical protein
MKYKHGQAEAKAVRKMAVKAAAKKKAGEPLSGPEETLVRFSVLVPKRQTLELSKARRGKHSRSVPSKPGEGPRRTDKREELDRKLEELMEKKKAEIQAQVQRYPSKEK